MRDLQRSLYKIEKALLGSTSGLSHNYPAKDTSRENTKSTQEANKPYLVDISMISAGAI